MGTNFRLFGNVSVRDPRHNSYHYLVLGCLHRASLKEHMRYLEGRKKIPLRPPTEPTREDKIFAALWKAIPKPRAGEAQRNEWILAATWILVNERVSARRDPAKDQTLVRKLGRTIKASVATDRRSRPEEAGSEVEKLVGEDRPLIQESCQQIKGWYNAAFDRALPPARVTLERITAERVELYSYVLPPGKNIPTSVHPFPVEDSVPTEDEIKWAVKRLCNNRSGGPSRMQAEHLRRWLATAQKAEKDKETAGKEEAATTTERVRTEISVAQKETDLESENWTRVVDLVQLEFREGKLVEEATWQAVVHLPLGNQDHRLPRCFLHKLPLPECQLGEVHDPRPVVRLQIRFLLRR